MLWVIKKKKKKKFGTMADGSNRGSGDAMSSQGSDEVYRISTLPEHLYSTLLSHAKTT